MITNKLSNSELITYSTVRLECSLVDGSTSFGTGFFFSYDKTTTEDKKVVLFTNKHVIENSTQLKLKLCGVNVEEQLPNDNQILDPILNIYEKDWIMHFEESVDLCMLPFDALAHQINTNHGMFFWMPLDKRFIQDRSQLEDLRTIEEVIMIGYPNSIWDTFNNKPIIRRGVTAVHPKFDYCGDKIGIIDIPCFPGSSGSPILIFNQGGYVTKEGDLSMKGRLIILGILFAGPQYTAEGEIIVKPIQVNQKISTETDIPMNLGYYIKAERILEMETLL